MRLLCLYCGAEIDVRDDERLTGCPQCSNAGVPADLDDAVDIHITKHELRILTMWADNYARSVVDRHPDLPNVVSTICNRLATQTDVPLTLSQEIADLRAAFPESKVKIYRGDGTEVDL